MNEVQDDPWIGRVKELLEGYTPAVAPGDWKTVKRRLSRSRSWSAWLLMLLRKPWTYAVMFCAGLLAGFLIFSREEAPPGDPAASPGAIPVETAGSRLPASPAVKPSTTVFVPERALPVTDPVISETAPAIEKAVPETNNIFTTDSLQNEGKSTTDILHTETASVPAIVPAPDTGKLAVKPKRLFDFPSVSLSGAPWKVGIGYEYLTVIQPDTAKGQMHSIRIGFNREVVDRLWVGGGITFGRTEISRAGTYSVRDWSRQDSLGIVYMRDSSFSYRRWQQHAALPVRVTYDVVRNSRFALPVTAGATFGWAYTRGYSFSNDGQTAAGGEGGAGFITADISLGFEYFSFKGISAQLTAEFRRAVAGSASYGYGKNYFGAGILLNLDFDKDKWK